MKQENDWLEDLMAAIPDWAAAEAMAANTGTRMADARFRVAGKRWIRRAQAEGRQREHETNLRNGYGTW